MWGTKGGKGGKGAGAKGNWVSKGKGKGGPKGGCFGCGGDHYQANCPQNRIGSFGEAWNDLETTPESIRSLCCLKEVKREEGWTRIGEGKWKNNGKGGGDLTTTPITTITRRGVPTTTTTNRFSTLQEEAEETGKEGCARHRQLPTKDIQPPTNKNNNEDNKTSS